MKLFLYTPSSSLSLTFLEEGLQGDTNPHSPSTKRFWPLRCRIFSRLLILPVYPPRSHSRLSSFSFQEPFTLHLPRPRVPTRVCLRASKVGFIVFHVVSSLPTLTGRGRRLCTLLPSGPGVSSDYRR